MRVFASSAGIPEETVLPPEFAEAWDRSQKFRGRRSVTVDVPLDTIPVFVRDGAEVPGP